MNERNRAIPPFRRLALAGDVAARSLGELWEHKARSLLTLTLLMLGVFALVLMTTLLDGLADTVRNGFAGISWDGTLVLVPRSAADAAERRRFAMSPGLRMEDLPRLTAPHELVAAFLPRATRQVTAHLARGPERIFVCGNVPDYFPVMNRRIASGRGLTREDQRRHATVAVLGASLASRVLGGADPVGRDLRVEGVLFRVVGVLAPMMVFSDDAWEDANGMLVPLEAYMDRLEPSRRLDLLGVKLRSARDLKDAATLMRARARQAHHGVEDMEVRDLDAEKTRNLQNFRDQMRGWAIVLLSLAGTVLLVGGVGVLSVMLISLSNRRYEIGLRKALGATDREIFLQFLLEAACLAALGALGGTAAGAGVCGALSSHFPFGLAVNSRGLGLAWGAAFGLSLAFGLYPALRARSLSPMEAMAGSA